VVDNTPAEADILLAGVVRNTAEPRRNTLVAHRFGCSMVGPLVERGSRKLEGAVGGRRVAGPGVRHNSAAC